MKVVWQAILVFVLLAVVGLQSGPLGAAEIGASGSADQKTPIDSASREAQSRTLVREGLRFMDEARFEEAMGAFDQARQLDDENWKAHQQYLESADLLGKLEEAQSDYRTRIEADPCDVVALTSLGHGLWEDDYSSLIEAEGLLNKALDCAPGDPVASLALGMIALDLGRLREAKELLKTASDHSDTRAEALAMLGFLHHAAGDMEAAKKVAERLIEEDPESVDALFILAYVYGQDWDFDQALQYLDQAEKLPGHFPDTLEGRLRINHYYSQYFDYPFVETPSGDIFTEDDAKELWGYYDRILSHNPRHFDTLVSYGAELAEWGEEERSHARLDQLLEFYPDDPVAQMYAGMISYMMEDYEAAREILESVRERMPDNLLAIHFLLYTYYRMRLYDECLLLAEETLKTYPESERAVEILEDIRSMKEESPFLYGITKRGGATLALQALLGGFLLLGCILAVVLWTTLKRLRSEQEEDFL